MEKYRVTFVFWTLFFFPLWWIASNNCVLSLIFLAEFSKTCNTWVRWIIRHVREGFASFEGETLTQSHLTCCAISTLPFVRVRVVIFFDYNIGKRMLYWISDCHLLVNSPIVLACRFLILSGLCVQATYDMIIMLCLYYWHNMIDWQSSQLSVL